MKSSFVVGAALVAALGLSDVRSAEVVRGRRSLVLEGQDARLVVDLAGGSIVDFRFRGLGLNPLNWAAPAEGETQPTGFGHFLCLDRWGPPSDAEGANGMPYHGEATHVEWTLASELRAGDRVAGGEMSARLPMAGLSVKRTLRMATIGATCLVREEVRNENKLGRVFNMVQHPTIGGAFLDETTVVDCNGRKGFAQGGLLPNPEEPSFYWPRALNQDGQTINLRHLTSDPNPNVVSYAIDDDFGWVTAATPGRGLLLGYLWPTRDYPWVSLWRDVRNGHPAARGLEFGTTGLHQPFPILTRKGTIFGRQLFEHLDAGESRTKSYVVFLGKVPTDFGGVGGIQVEKGRLLVSERGRGKERDIVIEIAELP
ncbi:MAG: hypothetical protein EXS36_17925 [Pedosphaera sp.]|nr:hypothetical protein [Pedosphaera sp.]